MANPEARGQNRRRRWPKDRREDRYNWELARGSIPAFGESKPLAGWAADERCAVSREALRTRLALGWDPADAITKPRHGKPEMTYTYNERTLTLRGWADQSGIKYHTLYNRIMRSGMSFTEALAKGAEGADFTLPVSAFGETKTLYHWAVDPRAGCVVTTMRRRLAQGWEPEQAITEEPQSRSRLGTGVPHRAFGLSMGLEDWGRHTQIPAGILRHRMDHYKLPLEGALTSLGWTPQRNTPAKHDLLHIAAAQLRPGDHILGTDHAAGGSRYLIVHRTSSAPTSTAAPRTPAPPRIPPTQLAPTTTTPLRRTGR
ncbi:hypothetical protein [Streptomyces jumonjinensis]|uniref:hypothetical protein n=1 Tax=Streptomyces jumonjinensis TaxID=1945 RepID=UPI0037A0D773